MVPSAVFLMNENRIKLISRNCVSALIMIAVLFAAATDAAISANLNANGSNLATITGVVRDQGGEPIANATVAIFRIGTSKLLKQVRSANDGSFLAKIIPGKYSILAVAEGFNPATISVIEVNRASLTNYGFKLERSGSGNTLPEKRLDRNNPKWNIRAAQTSRSIYQAGEGESPVANGELDQTVSVGPPSEEGKKLGSAASVAETFVASTDGRAFAGVNFASLVPITENSDLIIAAQAGIGRNAPQRFEGQLKFDPSADHRIRLKAGYGYLGKLKIGEAEESLGQFSLQAIDEWKVREGIVLVYGFDYSKFIGAGGDHSLSPRLGFQYDLDSKTRFRSSLTTSTEERTWAKAIELEDAQVFFREPVLMRDIAIENDRPIMNRSSRFELGIERVLDNRSSVELNAFFDTTFSRGVGIAAFDDRSVAEEFGEFVGNQQGGAQGVRFVYSRRVNGILSTSAGYSFGNGQQLSTEAISDPESLFESSFYHTVFGRVDLDLSTGTSVRTIFRLSPKATVFAIDPFQGRLAIYDPGLSVLVTQPLPNLGLPFKAEALLDARNIFDFHTGVNGEEGSIRLRSQGRGVRGSILVRF